jgi:hypothetical protein
MSSHDRTDLMWPVQQRNAYIMLLKIQIHDDHSRLIWKVCNDSGTGDFSRGIFSIGCKASGLRHGKSTPLEWSSRENKLYAGGIK